MKTIKRLASIAAAIVLAATVMAPATMVTGFAAADNSISVTATTGSVTFDEFNAYQIFAGTYNDADDNFTVTGWGTGVDTSKIADVFDGSAYFAGCTTAMDFADVLAGKANDSDEAKEFAKLIQNALSTTSTAATGTTISGLEDGYYIVVAGEGETDDGRTAWSSGLLQVVGGSTATVTPKADVASIEKKVWESTEDYSATVDSIIDEAWKDASDASVGDTVTFKLLQTSMTIMLITSRLTTHFQTVFRLTKTLQLSTIL